jgi:hypothetical protein
MRQGKGCGAKGKTPYKYSDLHQIWRGAVKRGDDRAAQDAARKHLNRFVRYADLENVEIAA